MQINRLWSIEAEAGVLGSMMIGSECIRQVLNHIDDSKMFFREANQLIFDAIMYVWMEKTPVDAVTVRAELKKRGWLEKVGKDVDLDPDEERAAVSYIGQLLDSVPNTANAEYYAREVVERSRYRQLVDLSGKIKEAVDEYETSQVIASKIQDLVANTDHHTHNNAIKIDGDEAINALQKDSGDIIQTGFRDIDNRVKMERGDMIIVAGRPSMGKSSLAVNMVEQMAEAKHPALIVSLETKRIKIEERILCRRARVNRRFLNDKAMEKLRLETEGVSSLPLYIADKVNSVGQVLGLVARAKRDYGIDVVAIDYMQLLEASGKKYDNRNHEISAISRALKSIAVRENVVMIVVCQLNRKVEERQDRRPRMSDIRESGALEQDADWILLLYRADYYRGHGEEPDGIAEVIVAKARDGETGTVKMLFQPELTSFNNLSYAQEP